MRRGERLVVGWREWVGLPGLGIEWIKAKVDTGARTSSLHAFDLEIYKRGGAEYVRFKVHPEQRNSKITVGALAKIHDFRLVKSSTGHQTLRPVIVTDLFLLGGRWPIELTLANRDEMGFRMLLGREACRSRVLVDAGKSYYSKNKPEQPKHTPRSVAKRKEHL